MESESKGHSIELLLSKESTETLREKLCEVEPGPWHQDPFRPHLSLAVIREPTGRVEELRTLVRDFARGQAPFKILISSMGIFPGKRPVLTLMPASNGELIDIHHRVSNQLTEIGISPIPYYRIGQWSPHITIMMGRPRREVSAAMEALSRVRWPGEYELDEVELVEFHPPVKLEKIRL